MKKLIIIALLPFLFNIGCSTRELTSEERMFLIQQLQKGLNDYSQQQIEIQKTKTLQIIPIPPQPQSNYWQEQAARQQYFRELERQRSER
jgi:hypothetical protein